MPTLKTQIQELTGTFAAGILEAIKGASLQEILTDGGAPVRRGPGRPRKAKGGTSVGRPRSTRTGGRLARRSGPEVEHVVGRITKALADAGKGLRSEEIQRLLKLDKKEIVRPIALALKAKRITKKGQKRATTYFVK